MSEHLWANWKKIRHKEFECFSSSNAIHEPGKNKYLLESTLSRIQHFTDGIINYLKLSYSPASDDSSSDESSSYVKPRPQKQKKSKKRRKQRKRRKIYPSSDEEPAPAPTNITFVNDDNKRSTRPFVMATTAAYAPGFLKPYSKGEYDHLLRVTFFLFVFFSLSLSPSANPILKLMCTLRCHE